MQPIKNGPNKAGDDLTFPTPPATGSYKVMLIKGPDDISVVNAKEAEGDLEQMTRLEDLKIAFTHLESTQLSEGYRRKIQLILATLDTSNPENTAFLQQVRKLPSRPFMALSSQTPAELPTENLADEILMESDLDAPLLTLTIRDLLPRVKQHWEENGKKERIEMKPFLTAKNAPLPALPLEKFDPERDRHSLLDSKVEGVYWVAMLDFDGTLYRPNSEHSIILHDLARFIKSRYSADFSPGNGNIGALNELIDYCDVWEDQRKRISQTREVRNPIKYPDGIKKSGKLSAAAFEGMRIETLQKYGKEFVTTAMDGEVLDYVPAVLQKLRDHGVLPTLVTGAPDFLLPSLLNELGMTHGSGMTYKVDQNGRLTGNIKVNMGIAEEKARHGEELTKRGYAIAMAIGDSVGDMGPCRCAVGRSLAKWDVNGGFVLVNGSDDAVQEVRRNYSNEMENGRVQVVDPRLSSSNVVAAVGLALRTVFEPLHYYQEISRDTDHPHRLAKYLTYLNRIREAGGQIDNLENIKRMRDALEREGIPKTEIMDILEQFYPKIVAEDVVKKHVINTRIPSDVEVWLKRIGTDRETIKEVLKRNNDYHKENGSLAPVIRKSLSSIPPSSKGNF